VTERSNPATLTRLADTGRTVADPAEDIRGMKVVDTTGEDLGKVDDLLVDRETERVHVLRVEHGGILGFGATPTFVPVEAVTRVDEDTVHIDRSREQVAGAPAYDPDLADETTYYDTLYGYFGYTPFWTGGYTYPGPVRRPAGHGGRRR
jgi:sporulation protein YlmC with PRC-barrel domain